MLASRRSWWRIAADDRGPDRPPGRAHPARQQHRPPREAPVLEATGPGQVWSWDITDLRSPWRGVAFKAYSIIDIYSRKLVGWRVEEREVDHLAVEMFEHAFAEHGVPRRRARRLRPGDALHRAEGPPRRSGVTQTHNRPRVSNDNPFSESEFRTMKYRPNYPGTFDDLDARPRLHGLVRALVQRTTSTPASPCSHPTRSTTAPGAGLGTARRRPSRPTTTPTPNASDAARPPLHPPASSASTCPRHDTESTPERLQAA